MGRVDGVCRRCERHGARRRAHDRAESDQSHLDCQRGERSQGSGRARHADSLSRKNRRRQMAGIFAHRLSRGRNHQRKLRAGVAERESRFLGVVFGIGIGNTIFLWAGTARSSEDSRHGRRSKRLVGDWPRVVALYSTGDQPRKEADHSADNSGELAGAASVFERWLAGAGCAVAGRDFLQ